ncbi:LCP family protein [Paractinoplanes globisporus]|uniref:LCP family protein n=1 Tax=Paractinoplanes globisporus TaxID=113565 RepID=A0ABW6WE66_9ACTN|nr:LCP family protein [Actinoplanes globisporus]
MRNRKLLWWIVGAVVVVLLGGGGIALAVGNHKKEPAAAASSAPPVVISAEPSVSPTPSPTPSPGADINGPLDLVLLGVDTRVTIPDWEPHSDTIMLLHVERGLKKAYLYSLPRDLRVKMPAFAKAGFGGGTYKLTEAMSRGSRVPGTKKTNVNQGYELLTKVLTQYTGIKQFQAGAILNFGGLDQLVDSLGGVDMVVDETVKSHHRKPDGTMRPLVPGGGDYSGPQAVYRPGKRHFVGWQAIDYARQRYGLPNGDYDRTRHQRQLVRAILGKALGQGLGDDPQKLQGVIRALGKSLVYVGGRTPLEYAYALRNLTPGGLTLVGLPGHGVGSGGGYLGEALTAEGKGFLTAAAKGQIAPYLAKHPKLVN